MSVLKNLRSMAQWLLGALIVVTLLYLVMDIALFRSEDDGRAECRAAYAAARTLRDTQLVHIKIPTSRRVGSEEQTIRCADIVSTRRVPPRDSGSQRDAGVAPVPPPK